MAEPVEPAQRQSLNPMYVSPQYRAPELWRVQGNAINSALSKAIDYWSFGCIVFELAVGTPAFPAKATLGAIEAFGIRARGLKLAVLSGQAMDALKILFSPVLCCMAPAPAQRSLPSWGTFEDFAPELGKVPDLELFRSN